MLCFIFCYMVKDNKAMEFGGILCVHFKDI
jgi:hypothetical protein